MIAVTCKWYVPERLCRALIPAEWEHLDRPPGVEDMPGDTGALMLGVGLLVIAFVLLFMSSDAPGLAAWRRARAWWRG